jgi:cytochrome P450
VAGGVEWDDGLGCWMVADPALARQVLADPGFSAGTFERSFQLYMTDEARAEHRTLTDFLRLWFVQCDGTEHLALRRPVQRQLSTSYFRAMRPTIEQIVAAALRELAARSPHDVVPSVADTVSARVMAHVVGLDEAVVADLHEWSRTLSAFIGAMYHRRHATAARTTTERMLAHLDTCPAAAGFDRSTPSARARTTATWAMVLFGGLETTAALLSSAVLRVLSDPPAWRTVDEDRPGAVAALVESIVESRPPLRNLGRVVAADQEFAGVRMRAGDLVLVSLVGDDLFGGHERDVAPHDHAEGEHHLVFGHGPHYCVGASLARLETAALLRHFVREFPGARLAADGVVWRPNLSYLGLDHLYVELDHTVPGQEVST